MNHVIHEAAARLSVPRAAPADSFVLHAPLELLGRFGLLEYADSGGRRRILSEITTLVEHFEAAGPPVEPGAPEQFTDPSTAAAALDQRLRAGDLEGVDSAAIWLTDRCTNQEVRHLLAEAIVDSLAAAGHAPIALHLLARVADGALPASLLRGPLRELARHPEWRLTWFRSPADLAPVARESATVTGSFADAIRAVPMLGRPGSDFIFPLMSQAEGSGAAAAAIAPALTGSLDVVSARVVLQRAAAWSMLNDDPTQAPYGWSHALTMPQAVLSLAGDGVDQRTAIAVAATFLVGFRAAHGAVQLGPIDDAAGQRAVSARQMPSIADLAGYAGAHEDAHLVKYTLACLHAGEADPAWREQYLAAAAFLAEWWRAIALPATDGE